MKLKSIGAVVLAIALVPNIVFGQSLLQKMKAKMEAKKAAHSSMMASGSHMSLKDKMAAMKAKMMGGSTTTTTTTTSATTTSTTASTMSTPAASGSIIGNKHTKVYHMPGDSNLPAEKNRVYFSSVAAAEAAGYHTSGAGAGKMTTGHTKKSKKSKKSSM